MQGIAGQQGFLTMVTAILIVITAVIAAAIAYVFSNGAVSSSNFEFATRALYLADSGLEQATRALLLPTVASRTSCGSLNMTNSTIGNGTFTVTATGPLSAPSPPTTLTSALTSSATTIPVGSTTGYQSSGRIMIDGEYINYTAVNSTNFLNAARGVDGSTATAHASGTAVGQYECQLSASGGVPTLTPSSPGNPGGIRKLTEAITLQQGWVVGNKPTTNNFSIATWNTPTEIIWSNASVASSSAVNLNSVSMVSYDNGWAVGANATFLFWDGSTWTVQNTSGLPLVTMNSVYCNTINDCHAVGGVLLGLIPVFDHWTGTSWTQLTPSNSSLNNLNSVQCDASTDCWAVGDDVLGLGKKFYQWDGTKWTGVSVGALTGFTFNSVFCNSSTDCWAVGANRTFARKNGASWANAPSAQVSSIPSTQYNAVYCNNSSDCWAVGNVNASANLFVHWNGTAWTRNSSTPTPVVNLNSVACFNTNDCWAVGAASGGQGTFFHWNGTSWTNFTVSGIPNVQLNSIALLGPSTQPWSSWSENFS